VEIHPSDAFEVEFLDSEGHTIALAPLKAGAGIGYPLTG
jgi:Domain of unknown function (DUF4926)